MSERPDPKRPVFARHAASLLLWRKGGQGLEVLMGLRGAGMRFMPNRLVFPGGSVDPADKRARAASEPDPATLAALSRRTRPPLARGLLVAAARELEEETSMSFGTPPRLDTMRYLCRAVTPPFSPIRFNARFLQAPAESATGTPQDTGELGAVRFYGVEEALGLDLMEVTREVLKTLRDDLALDGPARARRLRAYKRQAWIDED